MKNAFPKNAFSKNALSKNAFSKNAFSKNAFSKNAFSKNAFVGRGRRRRSRLFRRAQSCSGPSWTSPGSPPAGPARPARRTSPSRSWRPFPPAACGWCRRAAPRTSYIVRGLELAKLAKFQILQIFGGLVLGFIKTKFCKKICV